MSAPKAGVLTKLLAVEGKGKLIPTSGPKPNCSMLLTVVVSTSVHFRCEGPMCLLYYYYAVKVTA